MMLQRLSVLVLATVLLPSSGRSDVARPSDDQIKIQKVLDGIVDACHKKDIDRLESFHAYGAKFTKFEDDGLGRQDAVAGKKGERDAFTMAKSLALRLDNVKIDVFGNAAVATGLMWYEVDTGHEKMSGNDRVTLVFARDGGAWKIVHEHASPFKPASK